MSCADSLGGLIVKFIPVAGGSLARNIYKGESFWQKNAFSLEPPK